MKRDSLGRRKPTKPPRGEHGGDWVLVAGKVFTDWIYMPRIHAPDSYIASEPSMWPQSLKGE